MTIAPAPIPQNLLTLKGTIGDFTYTVLRGVIVGEVTIHPTEVGFFLKTDDGKEHDITLKTAIKAREGHDVSIIYASKIGADIQYPVGWVNHTTTKADYFNDVALKVVGNKTMTFFSAMAEGSLNATANLVEGQNGCMNFLILPVTLSFFGISLAFLGIAMLFAMPAYKQSKAVLNHAMDIARHVEPSLPPKKKPSTILKILKWLGIGFILFVIITSILDM